MYRATLVVLILLLILLQYRLWLGEGSYASVYRFKREIGTQSQVNQSLDARNRQLEAEINSLKEGDVATEERARADLGMVKEGESFYLITEP